MVSISRLAAAWTASAEGWVTSPWRTRKMHWRWAVTLRPVARNSSVSSSGVRIGAQLITNRLFFNNRCRYLNHRHRRGRSASTGRRGGPAGRPVRRRRPPAHLWQALAMSRPASADAPAPAGSDRDEALARLASETFDVLVIGGGITGAGVALDAASAGPADGPGREGRLRLGHVVEVVQADPRRAPLPPAARVPPGLREPGRTPAPARERPPPGLAAALPHPPVRPGRDGQPRRGPGLPRPPCGSTT